MGEVDALPVCTTPPTVRHRPRVLLATAILLGHWALVRYALTRTAVWRGEVWPQPL